MASQITAPQLKPLAKREVARALSAIPSHDQKKMALYLLETLSLYGESAKGPLFTELAKYELEITMGIATELRTLETAFRVEEPYRTNTNQTIQMAANVISQITRVHISKDISRIRNALRVVGTNLTDSLDNGVDAAFSSSVKSLSTGLAIFVGGTTFLGGTLAGLLLGGPSGAIIGGVIGGFTAYGVACAAKIGGHLVAVLVGTAGTFIVNTLSSPWKYTRLLSERKNHANRINDRLKLVMKNLGLPEHSVFEPEALF